MIKQNHSIVTHKTIVKSDIFVWYQNLHEAMKHNLKQRKSQRDPLHKLCFAQSFLIFQYFLCFRDEWLRLKKCQISSYKAVNKSTLNPLYT